MQVVNFSHFSHFPYLAKIFSPVNSVVAWLTQSASAKPLVPPANAPRAYERLSGPFGIGARARYNHHSALVATFKSSGFESQDRRNAPLKVVRERDATVGPSCAGRMTISGRMADVCAELERMTQRAAAL